MAEFLSEQPQGGEQDEPLQSAQQFADAQASLYSKKFRRAILINFLAAFIAITSAIVGLAFLKNLSPELKIALLAVELTTLGLIIVNTKVGRSNGWHRRWIESREIAEHLRIAMLVRRVAARPNGNNGLEERWTSWYVRQKLREAGLPSLDLDDQGLRSSKDALMYFAHHQRKYHMRSAAKAEKAEHWTERLGTISFLSAFAAVLASFLLAIASSEIPSWAKSMLGIAAVALPALGSTLLGIRLIADYAGIAERSRQTTVTLKTFEKHLAIDPIDIRHLRARAVQIAQIALAEVLEWRVSAEGKPLDWPG